LDYGLEWSDMLKLTRKADYGLIALRHLARNREGASAKEIAAVYGIPTPLLAKVLQKLARNGLLTAAYGTNGGYRLARDPRTINALEVVRAIDGPIVLTSCFTQHGRCQTVYSNRGNIERAVRYADLLIGATALSLGYSVLTNNARHFRMIPGLSVMLF